MLIDAHSHIDRYDLIDARALETAVSEINRNKIFTISNSMELASYKRNLEISKLCDWVLPIFGVHPWNASEYINRLEDLEAAIQQSPMLGEIGLDYYFIEDPSAYPAQMKVFEFYLQAAQEQQKIISLHTKGAEKEVLQILDRYRISRAIVHWYSGPMDIFRELVARGAYFTVGIEVLYSEHIGAIAQEIPFRQLLTETDNPGGPKAFMGKPGMPVLLRDIVQGIAQVRKTTFQAVEDTVQANLLELFRDDPWLIEVRDKILEKSQ